ncbi:hypothetical protein PCK2_000853 [Pneumocystis canis]|nr:hypothetical protein PCK2_000853 [Pneumocystis canis]
MLTIASSYLSRDNQIRLASNIPRIILAMRRLGLDELKADYWDSNIIQSIEYIPNSSKFLSVLHSGLELNAVNKDNNFLPTDPFIYNPFMKKSNIPTKHVLVEGDVAEFKVVLHNPLAFELEYLINPELDPNTVEDISKHPSQIRDRKAFVTMRVDAKDWLNLLQVHIVAKRVIACFCEGHALVLYVYIMDPEEESSAVLDELFMLHRRIKPISILGVLGAGVLYYYLANRERNYLNQDVYAFCTIRVIRRLSPSVCLYELEFDRPSKLFRNQPIQSVLLKNSDMQIQRYYTPISLSPSKVVLLVKCYEGGEVSRWIHRKRVGDRIELRGPFLEWAWDDHRWKRILFIAGGTGIAPAYQLLSYIFRDSNQQIPEFHLMYANRSLNEILLKEELDRFQEKYPKKIKITYFLDTPPENSRSDEYFVRRISLHDVNEAFPLWTHTELDTIVLVCGTDGFVSYMAGPHCVLHGEQGSYGGLLKKANYLNTYICKNSFQEKNNFGYVVLIEKTPELLTKTIHAKNVFLLWIPEFLVASSDDFEAYKRIEANNYDNKDEDNTYITLCSLNFQEHVYSISLLKIQSLFIKLPVNNESDGSISINTYDKNNYLTLFFSENYMHINLSNTPGSKENSCIFHKGETWGGEYLLTQLKSIVNIEHSLTKNMYLLNLDSTNATYSQLMNNGNQETISDIKKNKDIKAETLKKTYKEIRWSILERFSRITRFSYEKTKTILDTSFSKSSFLSNFSPQLQKSLNSKPPINIIEEYDIARLYLARWAARIAEDSERDKCNKIILNNKDTNSWHKKTLFNNFEILEPKTFENDMKIQHEEPISEKQWKSWFDHNGKLSITKEEVAKFIFYKVKLHCY